MSRKTFSRALALLAFPLALGACDTVKGTFSALTGGGGAPPITAR